VYNRQHNFSPLGFLGTSKVIFLRIADIQSMNFRILDNFKKNSAKDKKNVLNVTFVTH